jgi:AmmeMemoRadiSam system protein A
VANSPDLEFKKISYCNSGDSPYGNKDEVVGYNAIILIDKKTSSGDISKGVRKDEYEVSFTKAETDQLFKIARTGILKMLDENKKVEIDPSTIPANLKKKMGAFVTLKIGGNLRGCIGRFISEEPLYEVVNDMAVASAFSDNRFDPLSKEEYPKLEIEISVLGPLRKINDISEIIPGRHGIYIKKDYSSRRCLPKTGGQLSSSLVIHRATRRGSAGMGGKLQTYISMRLLFSKKTESSYVPCYRHRRNSCYLILSKLHFSP